MRTLKDLHPYQKWLIAAFVVIAMFTFLTSCGSIKKVVKTETQTNEVARVDSVSKTDQQSDTKFYGDTLKGKSFLPSLQNIAGADSTDNSDSVDVESAGIKLKIKVTPQKNKQGQFTGNKIDYNAIAKPIAQTDTHTQKQKLVHATKQTDTKTKNIDSTTTKAGFTIPWWLWLVAIAATLGVLLYFTKIIKF